MCLKCQLADSQITLNNSKAVLDLSTTAINLRSAGFPEEAQLVTNTIVHLLPKEVTQPKKCAESGEAGNSEETSSIRRQEVPFSELPADLQELIKQFGPDSVKAYRL